MELKPAYENFDDMAKKHIYNKDWNLFVMEDEGIECNEGTAYPIYASLEEEDQVELTKLYELNGKIYWQNDLTPKRFDNEKLIPIRQAIKHQPDIVQALEVIQDNNIPIYNNKTGNTMYIISAYDSVWVSSEKNSTTGYYVGSDIFDYLIDKTIVDELF